MSRGLLTLPNYLTAARLFLLPPLAIFIQQGYSVAALIVLVVAGLTDLFDGWIARKYKQESNVGKLMDPIADKVLLCVAVVYILAYGSRLESGAPALSPVLACLLLGREFLVSGLRAMASSVGLVMGASNWGKVKTAFQFVGLGALIIDGHALGLPAQMIGMVMLWGSVGLSYFSMVQYTMQVFRAFKKKGKL